MMYRLIAIKLLMLTFLGSTFLYSQENLLLRHASDEKCKMNFYILPSNKKVRFKDSLMYSWFRSQKVHQSQGSASGAILHGEFNRYFIDGQLSEKGNYSKGLRNGKWIKWYPNGLICSIYHYKKGVKNGKFVIYDEGHNISKIGKYRNGEMKLKKVKQPQKDKKNKKLKKRDKTEEESIETKKKFFKKIKFPKLFKGKTEKDSTKVSKRKLKKEASDESK